MIVSSKRRLGERMKNICDKIEKFGKNSKKSKLHSSKKRTTYYIPGILSILLLTLIPLTWNIE
jgi:hypothetical protein